MKTFPMFLNLAGRRVVIVGGGEQAAQKCRLMLKTEARIEIRAVALEAELRALFEAGRIVWHPDALTANAFKNAALVFIATGCPGFDAAAHGLAKSAGALVNVVDQPALCDAITPSIVDRDPVVVAIGTEGTAPVLARQIKSRIEEMLEPRLGDLAALAGRLRNLAALRLGPRDRRDLWCWVFDGPIRRQHARGAEAQAARDLKRAIETGQCGAAVPAPVAVVGVGPGCSDLITLRGVKRMQEADIIYHDRLVDPQVLELARRDAERVGVGMSQGCQRWPQSKINQVLINAARRGQRVVILKSGNPGVFEQDSEEVEALKAAGIDYEIVPGVVAAHGTTAKIGDDPAKRACDGKLSLTSGRAAIWNSQVRKRRKTPARP